MATYALVSPEDTVLREVDESRLDLTADTRAGYRWLPVVPSTVDNSTGPDTVSEGPVLTVLADSVTKVTTIRDMTAQEIADAEEARADAISTQDMGKMFLSVFRVMYGIAQQITPGVTPAQFKTFVDNETASADIPVEAFKTWVKERF